MFEQLAAWAGLKFGGHAAGSTRGARRTLGQEAPPRAPCGFAPVAALCRRRAERPAWEGRAAFSTIRPSTPACLWPRTPQHLPQRACGS